MTRAELKIEPREIATRRDFRRGTLARCGDSVAEYARDFSYTPRAYVTHGHMAKVRSFVHARIARQTKRPEDAALKFRGCFQAVCEPRSVPIGRRGLVSPQGGMVCSRQGVVVLEPTYRVSK